MEHLSSAMGKQQNQVQWRRDKVQELCSKGYSQREISQTLQVGLATVNRDVSYLRNQPKTNIKRYIDERLPDTSEQTEDKREKIQALSLAKECYSMKLDLLTNATVVVWIIRIKMAKNQTSLIMMKMKIS
jgi:IS30 family transposase